MNAIVINRMLSGEEQASVKKQLARGNIVYEKGSYGITEEEKKQINYETMDLVISFGDKKFEGKPVADWMKFEESSIWYYHKFRAYFRLRNLKYEIAALQKLAKDHDKVYYYASDPLLSKAALPGHVKVIRAKKGSAGRRNIPSIFNYLIILKSRWLLNIFSFGKPGKSDHILVDVTRRQAFLEPGTLKEKKGNYVIGYLLAKAGKDFLILDESVQPKMTDGASIKLSRDHLFGKGKLKRRYFGEPVLLNYLLSPGTRKRKKQLDSEINRALKHLHQSCQGDEKSLISIYRSFGGATQYYIIKYLAYRRFFSRNKFKTITSVDENSPALRCILDAARAEGITTIGMQHGNIHDLHPAYIYTPDDMQRHAVPDHSLVWGNYWKGFLAEKGRYREDSLHITGQIRTDIIPELKKAPILKKQLIHELEKDDKLIVFASQPQRDASLRERAALDIINAVKSIPDAFLVIKLHPNERHDVDYYAALARQAGLDRIRITLDVDLYLLISVCDLLITCFSTVGTETVYFKKPLIILDHLKQDIQHYHKEGVAWQACNQEELSVHIKNIFDGTASIDEEAYEKFIAKYAFAIDGKAADRALAQIRRLGDQVMG